MQNMVMDSFKLVDGLIAVRYDNAKASDLVRECILWLNKREAEEWIIRNSCYRVAQKLDLLDKATDRVSQVLMSARIAARGDK